MKPWGTHDGLAVYRFGEGPPALFMPGPHRFERPGLRNADLLIEGLVKLHRDVITFDPPGSGLSTRPCHLGMREMLICADEALDYVGVEGPVDVVGHSMGGMVSVAYAIERPSRVRSLVLIGTGSGGPAYMNAPGALWNKSHPRYGAMARLGVLHQAWPFRAPERMLRNLINGESFVDRSLAERMAVTFRDWFRMIEGRTDWHWQARKLDYSDQLSQISVRCLLVCGRQDPQFPLACSMQLAEHIPNARLVIFERSSHFPYIEERELFWSTVARFFAVVDTEAVSTAPVHA